MTLRNGPTFGQQHIRAALVACVVSLALHAAIIALMSRAQVRVRFFPAIEAVEEWANPVRLVEIIRELAFPPPESPKPPERAEPGAGPAAGQLARAPDESLTEVPPLTADRMKAAAEALQVPAAATEPGLWQLRQEILAIEKPIVADEVAALPRRRIPKIERVSQAPDVVFPVDRRTMEQALAAAGLPGAAGATGRAEVERSVVGGVGDMKGPAEMESETPASEELASLTKAPVPGAREIRPIEKHLKARMSVYASFWEPKHAYFKIEIERIGPETLPVLPKDFVFVQDCSASMSEQKLFFCRQGLTNCLTRLGPEDRFNLIGFRDEAEMCFTNWAENTADNVEKAQAFAMDMKATGNTDIYTAAKKLMESRQTPGRPLIAFLITDGRATAGLRRSTDIIGEFSRANEGRVSVCAMGTSQTANEYLLDLLSYCNRGDAYVETRGRWEIPVSMVKQMLAMSRPVLSEVKFRFPDDSPRETYPTQTSNLYADRPLTIHGRRPKGAKNVVFQAVGRAGDAICDMVFDLSMEKDVTEGDKTIRLNWAKQKIYYLMGQCARKGERALLDQMRETAKTYHIAIPYEKEM
ncbi:MAG: VWA domain-containing protein [Verrucomicrobiota bacterium]|nr:VWA domain-containing protein [Verrucomicrobiota bacterium]